MNAIVTKTIRLQHDYDTTRLRMSYKNRRAFCDNHTIFARGICDNMTMNYLFMIIRIFIN